MDSEIQSMHQNQVWYLVGPREGLYQLGVSGSSKRRLMQMDRLTFSRQGWWQKVIVKGKELIMMKHLHQLP